MNKGKVREHITTINPFYETVTDYISQIQDAINSLPTQYDRNSVLLNLDRSDYSDGQSVWITAERFETDDEYAKRLKQIEAREQSDRKLFETLKKKFDK